jgi:hypothetical protein
MVGALVSLAAEIARTDLCDVLTRRLTVRKNPSKNPI